MVRRAKVKKEHYMSLIRFFHGCAQLGDISISVGGIPVARQLSYGEATPHFLVRPGQTQIRVEEKGVVRLQNHVIVPEEETYTVLILCRESFPEMIAIAEDGRLLDLEQSGVRVGSFAQSNEQLQLWRRFAETDELLFEQIERGDVSEYVQLEPGQNRFEIREGNAAISMLPGQNIEKGQLYTLYILGKNDPEEDEYPVAIILLPDVATNFPQPHLIENTGGESGKNQP